MKILLLQSDIILHSPQENFQRITKQLIANKQNTDLIVLPELFTTGVCGSPSDLPDDIGIQTLTWMKNIAQERNTAIAGSTVAQEKGKYYNRLYFVKPDGSYATYDKRHLFSFADEDKSYTAGTERQIVHYNEFRIMLQICYDLRFPVFVRNKNDYDLIIYVANWPTQRIEVWNTLLRARAIENQCYVVGVNRVGQDPTYSYSGGTTFIDFYGNPIGIAESEKEDAICEKIDIKNLIHFRKKFPAWSDADDFTLKDQA